MRVFMLGWEFPPLINGGLGTACYGLTTALSKRSIHITFVLPQSIENCSKIKSVKMLSPTSLDAPLEYNPGSQSSTTNHTDDFTFKSNGKVTLKTIPSKIHSPYHYCDSYLKSDKSYTKDGRYSRVFSTGTDTDDLVKQAHHYAALCVALAAKESFDVIHAHDWFTFPAALAVARASGKPLIVHVHSTEYDRSGQWVNQQILDIEKQGVYGADKVIAVSNLTKNILVNRYGAERAKVQVVHNGITLDSAENSDDRQSSRSNLMSRFSPGTDSKNPKREKIVLFLGRITMQKGPEYFVSAAKKVLSKYTNVKFVVAGNGDRMPSMIEQVARERLGSYVLFTGFLSGSDVQRAFRMADVYVMPSVSEPFGIAPLEAISNDVPVIVSRSAGVGEVLNHVLKVDFWDINQMAEKIVAVLRHSPLSHTLRSNSKKEIARITWDRAAERCVDIYSSTSLPV